MAYRLSQLFTRAAPSSSPSAPHEQSAGASSSRGGASSSRATHHTRNSTTRASGHTRKRDALRDALGNLPRFFSDWSTPAIDEAYWCSSDLMLGAGMVIFQPDTRKIVCVYERARKYWFLPKGRKDVGQSLEETALREAYEETGYRATFLPLCHHHHQPSPDRSRYPSTEPLYVHAMSWRPRLDRAGNIVDPGGEYLTTWYAGQIPVDAPHQANTGMPDEVNYESYLLSFEQALQVFRHDGFYRILVEYAIKNFLHTERIMAEEARQVSAAASPTAEAAPSGSAQQEPAPSVMHVDTAPVHTENALLDMTEQVAPSTSEPAAAPASTNAAEEALMTPLHQVS